MLRTFARSAVFAALVASGATLVGTPQLASATSYGGYHSPPSGQSLPTSCITVGSLYFDLFFPALRHNIEASTTCVMDYTLTVFTNEFNTAGNAVANCSQSLLDYSKCQINDNTPPGYSFSWGVYINNAFNPEFVCSQNPGDPNYFLECYTSVD